MKHKNAGVGDKDDIGTDPSQKRCSATTYSPYAKTNPCAILVPWKTYGPLGV